jgi:DNA-binding MarR family transcriptional regulator
MDENNNLELRILEEIEQGGAFTQRDLSKKLSIALGLANAYLRRLIEKGYVMVSTMPRHRVFYNLTPKGIMEKGRLTLLYMRDSLHYYRDLRERIGKTLQALRERNARRVVILGTGEIAEIVYIMLRQAGLEPVAVVEIAPKKTHFLGLEVFGVEHLAGADFDALVVAEDPGENPAALEKLIAERRLPLEKMTFFTGEPVVAPPAGDGAAGDLA